MYVIEVCCQASQFVILVRHALRSMRASAIGGLDLGLHLVPTDVELLAELLKSLVFVRK